MKIMLAILYPTFVVTLLLIYVMMRNTAKPKKNIILGVTLPFDGRNAPETQEIIRKFKKELNIACLLLFIAATPSFFFKHMSTMSMYLMTFFLFVIAVPYIPYIRANKKLKALKHEKGWISENAGKAVVDTKVALTAYENPKYYTAIWFALPLIVSLIPIIMHYVLGRNNSLDGFGPMILYITCTSIILLFIFINQMINRQRAEIVDENTALSTALTRIRKSYWNKCYIYFAWGTAFYSLIVFIAPNFWGMAIGTILYTVFIMILAISVELKIRKLQQDLTAQSGTGMYVDEDDYWIWGIFYYNPNDNHVMKNERIGMNMTMNFAKTTTKIVMGLSFLAILLLPAAGVWMMAEEFTPITLSVNEEYIVAHHLNDRYKIEIDTIEDISLVSSDIKGTRVAGTGLDNVSKGLWNLEDYGGTELCLNPEIKPYIYIKTDDKQYLLGADDSENTETSFAELEMELVQ